MDLIDRQAAIDTLNEYFERIGKLKRKGLTKGEKAISLDTVGAIKTLPSVQPEPSEVTDVQKMQDLEQAELQKAYELGKLDAMEEQERKKGQ